MKEYNELKEIEKRVDLSPSTRQFMKKIALKDRWGAWSAVRDQYFVSRYSVKTSSVENATRYFMDGSMEDKAEMYKINSKKRSEKSKEPSKERAIVSQQQNYRVSLRPTGKSYQQERASSNHS